jgi:hypothetical protein
MMKSLFCCFLLLMAAGSLAGHRAAAQGVGIGTAAPDAKAALDIRATDKGLLIPRLTASQRLAIPSPPQGLMVYQTDGTASGGAQTGFWYYVGTGGWVYLDAAPSGGLTLPYSGTYSGIGNAFGVSNTGIGAGIVATTALSTAVSGTNTGSGTGLSGTSGAGTGVAAASTSGTALAATKSGTQTGRAASLTNTNAANDSTTAYISTAGDRPALRAVNTATSAQAAIRGVKQSASTDGIGVEGVVTSGASGNAAGVRGFDQSGSSGGSGVIGLTAGGYGVRGIATAGGGYGVSGSATDSYGVIGSSQSGTGAQGSSTSGSGVVGITSAGNVGGVAGVKGTSSNSSGIGVLGLSSSGYGVRGEATGSSGYGVTGVASGANGYGLVGTGSGGASGVYGTASGTGRAGYFNQTSSTATQAALEVASVGRSSAIFVTHPQIINFPSPVFGMTIADAGGTAQATFRSDNIELNPLDGTAGGVFLNADYGGSFNVKNNDAVSALCSASGVSNPSNYAAITAEGRFGAYAGRFTGNVSVTGSLSKGGGSFKIDHPLDPENQYLYHSFVESPDMLNVYNGNVTLDARGEATVTLPDYFEALNRDFRYQLTPIGTAFTPYVLAEVAGNQFRIAGLPGGKVSWQVTGIRQDKWANLNRIPTEQPKEPGNRGKYLHPEAYGQPLSRGIGYQPELNKAAARR